jgi:hypothetical protein
LNSPHQVLIDIQGFQFNSSIKNQVSSLIVGKFVFLEKASDFFCEFSIKE